MLESRPTSEMQSRDECRSRGERRRGDAETRGRAEPRRTELREMQSRDQTRDESRENRAPAETRRWMLAETRCRAPAETKAERRQRRESSRNRDAKRERKHEQWQPKMLELVRRALLYTIERAQRLPWCCKWRVVSTSTPTSAVRGVHLTPVAPLTLAAHARYCIRHARVTTPPTQTWFYKYSTHRKV